MKNKVCKKLRIKAKLDCNGDQFLIRGLYKKYKKNWNEFKKQKQ